MTENESVMSAVSALLGEAERDHKELLDSVANVARGLFGAAAASVFLFDEQNDELVFEAVSGEGEDHLIGRRFPVARGVVGWVLAAQEPVVVTELATNAVFARDLAESTGYVPRSLMAAPLLHRGAAVGVMEVLDPTLSAAGPLAAADLLTLFAGQAAIALGVIQRNRAARRMLTRDVGENGDLADLARMLEELGADRRDAGLNLLESLHRLLSQAR
jgi:GAF domain-containing protein